MIRHEHSVPLRAGFFTWREKAGTAALEFAMVTPALLAMFIGVICFGILFMNLHEVQELASSAARASIPGLSAAERNSLAQAYVTQALASSAMLNPADVTVTTATSGVPATTYAVTVNYNLKDTVIPQLAKLISQKFNTVSRTSTVVFGGY
jgi:Flp pilus assembly protein TadG